MTITLQVMDTILLILLIGFIAWGFGNGFIRALGGIIGIILAAAVASHYYLFVVSLVGRIFGPYQGLANISAFALIFLIVGRLFGILVHLFEMAFDVLAIVPFLKSINRVLGALFGLVLGALFLGTLLFIAGKYSQWIAFNDSVVRSDLAQYLLASARPLQYLYPQALLQLRSYF